MGDLQKEAFSAAIFLRFVAFFVSSTCKTVQVKHIFFVDLKNVGFLLNCKCYSHLTTSPLKYTSCFKCQIKKKTKVIYLYN